ncbi:hypothetical protein ZIOFF_023684 [Zingiber officinale]|uniref:DUF7794 domain-containing protein n=1 Tax=Zingiber officinale TaxID=94328 RepID=A0A8J5L5Q4_ZINOF|nr:hypothetical protein ZIOFF_023684 [Zingiber officinale]
MDVRRIGWLCALFLASTYCLQARGESSGSVVFLDGSSQKYIRASGQEVTGKVNSLSMHEVAATLSVLLGFAPSSSLLPDSADEINKILLPNPFDRPHAIYMMQISGIEEPLKSAGYMNNQNGNVFTSRISGSSKVTLELPGEDEVSVVPLNDPLDPECDAACLDKELTKLATWMGGSYVGTILSLDGKLLVPLSSSRTLSLFVSKVKPYPVPPDSSLLFSVAHYTFKADFQFAVNLVSLIRNVKKAMEIHEDLSGSTVKLSEIMMGHFTGIEALREEYGWGKITQQGVELLHLTLLKLFDMLQVCYEGKIVGVIISNNGPSSESGMLLDMTHGLRIPRLLEEAGSTNSVDSAVLLVRRSLAWITGIILLVSTLIGVYLLLNMPLVRDTLLYSNIKLD